MHTVSTDFEAAASGTTACAGPCSSLYSTESLLLMFWQVSAGGPPHTCVLVMLLECIPLFLAAVSANGGHVQHTSPELNEGAPLDGYIYIRQVFENKIEQLFQAVLSEVCLQALHRQLLCPFVCHQAIL